MSQWQSKSQKQLFEFEVEWQHMLLEYIARHRFGQWCVTNVENKGFVGILLATVSTSYILETDKIMCHYFLVKVRPLRPHHLVGIANN